MGVGRARWGFGGALNSQSAIARLKSPWRARLVAYVPGVGVDNWVPRGGCLQTPSGPEGSSGTQRCSGCRGIAWFELPPGFTPWVTFERGCATSRLLDLLSEPLLKVRQVKFWVQWKV